MVHKYDAVGLTARIHQHSPIHMLWCKDIRKIFAWGCNKLTKYCVLGMLVFQFMLLNSLRPRQNREYFADDVFKRNFLNENVWIPIEISLKFVPKGSINNIPVLVQIMAWCRPGDKPLSEPMMVSLLTHICVTRPQWVNCFSSAVCDTRIDQIHLLDLFWGKENICNSQRIHQEIYKAMATENG